MTLAPPPAMQVRRVTGCACHLTLLDGMVPSSCGQEPRPTRPPVSISQAAFQKSSPATAILPERSLCGACTCAPPAGSCKLPTSLTTAAASCAGDNPSVAHLPFNPPADWTGTCSTENRIPAGKLCDGVPCVQSVTSAPLTMMEGGCLPITAPQIKPPLASAIFARGCLGDRGPGCAGISDLCKPAAPGPEFKQCIFHAGDTGYSGALPRTRTETFFTQSPPLPAPLCVRRADRKPLHGFDRGLREERMQPAATSCDSPRR